MKRKHFVIVILLFIILLLAVFLYLYLTRNELLNNLPWFTNQRIPAFQYYLQGDAQEPLDSPMGLAVGGNGYLYVTDAGTSRVVVFDRDGRIVRTFGGKGTARGQFDYPYGIAVHNSEVYVADKNNNRVQVFSENGEFVRMLVQSGRNEPAGFIEPAGLAVHPGSGRVYFADLTHHRVVVLDSDGNFIGEMGGAESGSGYYLAFPNGVAVDDNGLVYIADSNNSRVLVVSEDGKRLIREFDGERNGEGKFALPRGIAVDGSGRVWVVDTLTHRVAAFQGTNRLFNLGGLGVEEGQLYFPNGLAIDKEGRIYVTERGLNRISVFGTQAVIQP